MLYGGLPPYDPQMSPTATVTGAAIWAVSGVEMALCDLAGKILGHARSTTCSAVRSATGSGSTSTGRGSPIPPTSARGERSRSA